jgi:hypothetical protein
MAITANTVFELTMALIDEIASNGIVDAQGALDYQGKAPRLINILQFDLCRRLNVTPTVISSLSDTLSVTDDVAYRILPYGLAGLMLLIEDPQTASYYNSKYEELRKQIPSTWETITDVYADGSDV